MERILPPGGLGPNAGAGGGTAHSLNARLLCAENDRLTRQLAEAQAEIERLNGISVIDREFCEQAARDAIIWKDRAEKAKAERVALLVETVEMAKLAEQLYWGAMECLRPLATPKVSICA